MTDQRHSVCRVAALLILALLGARGAPAATRISDADADFLARSQAPGVVRAVGFDAAADIAGRYGDNSGILPGMTTPALDAGVKASGAGSLRFTIPTHSPADTSGSYFTNASADLSIQWGESQEFYMQWRQRFSPEFLSTVYQGGGGWKQAIIGTGDKPGVLYASCTALEIVTQNTYQRGFAQLYNSCTGSASHGPYDPFEEFVGNSDIALQNARDGSSCLYSQGLTHPPSFFPPTGNCFGYAPNEWMTFQVGITTGPRVNNEFIQSRVRLWIAREGKPSELVIDFGPYNLSAGPVADDQKFGKVWLLPYHTGKDPAQDHPTAYTWYDELILSTKRIPDPGSASSGSPPAAPTRLTATAVSSTGIDLAWVPSTGASEYRIYQDGIPSGTSSSPSFAQRGLASSTPHTYSVSAVDSAGTESARSTPASATTLAATASGRNGGGRCGATGLELLGVLGLAVARRLMRRARR